LVILAGSSLQLRARPTWNEALLNDSLNQEFYLIVAIMSSAAVGSHLPPVKRKSSILKDEDVDNDPVPKRASFNTPTICIILM